MQKSRQTICPIKKKVLYSYLTLLDYTVVTVTCEELKYLCQLQSINTRHVTSNFKFFVFNCSVIMFNLQINLQVNNMSTEI